MSSRAFYLEDLGAGQRFVSQSYILDETHIVEFARVYDPQVFHLDSVAAKKSFFEGIVASGWQTAALSMRLMLEAFPIAGGTIGLGGEAAWPLPTRPGDSLHVEGEVLAIKPARSHEDRGIVTVRTETKNQHNEIVQVLTAKLLVFRRNAFAASAI